MKVQAIQRFTSTASAIEDLAAVQEGKLTDAFSKFLVDATGGAGASDGEKKKKKKLEETLIVAEPKLGEQTEHSEIARIKITDGPRIHDQQTTFHPRHFRLNNAGSLPRYQTAARFSTRWCRHKRPQHNVSWSRSLNESIQAQVLN